MRCTDAAFIVAGSRKPVRLDDVQPMENTVMHLLDAIDCPAVGGGWLPFGGGSDLRLWSAIASADAALYGSIPVGMVLF